jgi:hypothetical protein
LNEIKTQTQLSTDVIGQLKQSNEKSVEQSRLLGKQIKILSSEQKESNRLRQLSQTALTQKLINTSDFINDLYVSGGLQPNNKDSTSRLKVIRKLQSLLESELSNIFLLEHKKLAKEWKWAYATSRQVLNTELSPDSTFWTNENMDGTNGNEGHLASKKQAQESKIKQFNMLAAECWNLYEDVLHQIIYKEEGPMRLRVYGN